jgi:murein L,D-transpeptidase YcbB/YkuD
MHDTSNPLTMGIRLRSHKLWLALSIVLLSCGVSTSFAADDTALRTAIQGTIDRLDVIATSSTDSRLNLGLLRTLYVRHGFAALWVQGGKPTSPALALLQQLRAPEAFGLHATDYAGEALAGLIANQPDDRADATARLALFDVELSSEVARFLTHLHSGRIAPSAAGFDLGLRGPELDLEGVIARSASAADVTQVLESVEPRFYHYRLLKEALARYRVLAAEPGLTDLPPLPGHSVKAGENYVGAPALRKLLRALGDLTETDPDSERSLTFDPDLVSAVRRFQTRHGVEPDGSIGPSTFRALTTPLAFRERQIELTLERWRWLPAFETPPIIVNIPQFRLFAFRSTEDLKADILQMDVIVGRSYPKMRTPVFAADMKYVIFRPYWDVPYSIVRDEMLPQIRSNPGYLAAQHLEIVRGATDDAEPLAPTAANLSALASGKLRLRQQPGPDNALGLIKFMLPNSYNVYLHSTPAHRLFRESRRAFSHGCIRVSDPVALAAHVLQGTPGDWSPEKIESAMNGEATSRANLAKPIRVMILYGTALATEAGTVLFFDDIYGQDHTLEALLQRESLKAHPAASLSQRIM